LIQEQVALGVDLGDLEPPLVWTACCPSGRAIRMPLKTRAGKALAPIEPGGAHVVGAVRDGPRLKLWRLIPPWNPLPIEIPRLHFLAGLEAATVTSSPTFGALLGAEVLVAELDQVAHRRPPGLLQVAFLALLSLPCLTSPKASCTAA
jgi:hypothetical protein